MGHLAFRVSELALRLVHPFAISRGSEDVAHSVLIEARRDGLTGTGEASPSSRYGESVASVRQHFAEHPPLGDDPYLFQRLLAGRPPAARCALELALHDLIGKECGQPLYRLLGLDPAATPCTSFTIGIGSLEETERKLAPLLEHPILKVKVGRGNEIDTLELIRSRYNGTIRLDANEGWDPGQAVRALSALKRFGIEFCEQPVPAGHPEQLRYVRERSGVAIVADEDAKSAADLPALAGCVDGVNIKLVKCGGIDAALGMLHTARALGLRVMIGCMVESAIGVTAAAHLSPAADWADLDGPFLTADDPFEGVTYERGKLRLPSRPGLGVVRKDAAA